jgi:hypothetical protein
MPGGKFGQGMRRRRGDDHRLGLAAEPDVQDVGLRTPQIGVDVGFASGDGGEGQRCDEALGCVTQDDVDERTGLRQLGGQVDRFVAGNGAGDPEQDLASSQDRNDRSRGHLSLVGAQRRWAITSLRRR